MVVPDVQLLQNRCSCEVCVLLQFLVGEQISLALDDSLFVRREDPESNGLSGSHGCIINEALSGPRIKENFYIGITMGTYLVGLSVITYVNVCLSVMDELMGHVQITGIWICIIGPWG